MDYWHFLYVWCSVDGGTTSVAASPSAPAVRLAVIKKKCSYLHVRISHPIYYFKGGGVVEVIGLAD